MGRRTGQQLQQSSNEMNRYTRHTYNHNSIYKQIRITDHGCKYQNSQRKRDTLNTDRLQLQLAIIYNLLLHINNIKAKIDKYKMT